MKDHSSAKPERKQTRQPEGEPAGKPPRGSDGDSGGDVGNTRRAARMVDRQERGREGEWRDGFGAYVPGYLESPGDSIPRSGYGEQGFGAGEIRGSRLGGGERGGYGGGQPGGHGSRDRGWAAGGERHELGRGPRSYGPHGWGAAPGQRTEASARAPQPARTPSRRSVGRHEHPGGYDESEAAWRKSEFAGRGEFGDRDHGRAPAESGWELGASVGPGQRYTESWAVPGPYTGRGPEGYSRSEAAIRDDVCERLTRHGHLDASRIRVQVENGEVVLEGTVDSRQAKRMAEEAAETVSGVRDIHNRLRIESSG